MYIYIYIQVYADIIGNVHKHLTIWAMHERAAVEINCLPLVQTCEILFLFRSLSLYSALFNSEFNCLYL